MSRSLKQTSLLPADKPTFGGSALKSNPKFARPLSTKRPIHLVLKSSMATGSRSMLSSRHSDEIKKLIDRQAKACGVRVYHYANAGNHLHLVLKIHSARLYKRFVRAVTGLIARQVLGAERNAGKLSGDQKFWVARPFTRIASWGRDYSRLIRYVGMNTLEALGFVLHQPRGRGALERRDKFFGIKTEPD